jgi:hypothetical protein
VRVWPVAIRNWLGKDSQVVDGAKARSLVQNKSRLSLPGAHIDFVRLFHPVLA